MGQMMYTKLIVAVDETVDVQNLAQVRDAVLKNVRGAESLFLSEGPLDALDHSSDRALYGSRLGVDATAQAEKAVENDVTDTYHILPVHKENAWQGREALKEYMKQSGDKFTIAVDGDVDPADLSTVMWKVFNNIDAKRDIVLLHNQIGIDATKKLREEGLTRDWPDDITMAATITALSYCDEAHKASDGADNLRSQIKDYLEDSSHARMEAEEAKREIERLKREIQTLRARLSDEDEPSKEILHAQRCNRRYGQHHIQELRHRNRRQNRYGSTDPSFRQRGVCRLRTL